MHQHQTIEHIEVWIDVFPHCGWLLSKNCPSYRNYPSPQKIWPGMSEQSTMGHQLAIVCMKPSISSLVYGTAQPANALSDGPSPGSGGAVWPAAYCKNIHVVSRNISVPHKMRNIENWLFKSATSKDIKQLKASRLPQVLAVFVHLQSLRQLTSLWDYWLDGLDETGSIASSFRAVDTLPEGQQSMQLSVTVQSADHSKDANLPQGLAVQCGLPHTAKIYML